DDLHRIDTPGVLAGGGFIVAPRVVHDAEVATGLERVEYGSVDRGAIGRREVVVVAERDRHVHRFDRPSSRRPEGSAAAAGRTTPGNLLHLFEAGQSGDGAELVRIAAPRVRDIELALVAQRRAEELREPAASRQDLDDAHVLAHPEEAEDLDRQAVHVAGPLLRRADLALHCGAHALLEGSFGGLLRQQQRAGHPQAEGGEADASVRLHVHSPSVGTGPAHCTEPAAPWLQAARRRCRYSSYPPRKSTMRPPGCISITRVARPDTNSRSCDTNTSVPGYFSSAICSDSMVSMSMWLVGSSISSTFGRVRISLP